VNAYSAAGWENFFVAEAGASAALAGLLFVAVSINLPRILQFPGLPGRAAEALVVLFAVLASASLGLVPGQSPAVFGTELLAIGLGSSLLMLVIQVRGSRYPGQQRRWTIIRIATTQVAAVPFAVAGASVLARAGGGLYWLAPAIVLSFFAALLDAWVLLIEIQR